MDAGKDNTMVLKDVGIKPGNNAVNKSKIGIEK